MPEELTLLPCPACGFTGENHYVNLQSNFYSIKCSTCGLETGIGHTLQDAVDVWNSLPRALTWTTEPPKEPGRYWCRDIGSTKSPCAIAYIPAVDDRRLYSMDKHEQIEWAGPIPMPKEHTNV